MLTYFLLCKFSIKMCFQGYLCRSEVGVRKNWAKQSFLFSFVPIEVFCFVFRCANDKEFYIVLSNHCKSEKWFCFVLYWKTQLFIGTILIRFVSEQVWSRSEKWFNWAGNIGIIAEKWVDNLNVLTKRFWIVVHRQPRRIERPWRHFYSPISLGFFIWHEFG